MIQILYLPSNAVFDQHNVSCSSDDNGFTYLTCEEIATIEVDIDALKENCIEELGFAEPMQQCGGDEECMKDKVMVCMMQNKDLKRACGDTGLQECMEHYDSACDFED